MAYSDEAFQNSEANWSHAIAPTSPNLNDRFRSIRFAASLTLATAFSVGFAVLGVQVARPLQKASSMHLDNLALQHKLNETREKNQKLLHQISVLDSGVGVPDFLRQKGFMRENERPLRLQAGEGAAPLEPPADR